MLRSFLSGKDNHKRFLVVDMMVVQFVVCVCSGEKRVTINVQIDSV